MSAKKSKKKEDDELDLDEEKFITEIQYNGRIIWHKRDDNHSNKTELSAAWDIVITNCGYDPKDKSIRYKIRQKWQTLKGRFSRELQKEPKPTSGSAAQHFKSSFEHYNRLAFLREVLKPAQSEGNYTNLVEQATKEEEKEEEGKKEKEEEGDNKVVEEEAYEELDLTEVVGAGEAVSSENMTEPKGKNKKEETPGKTTKSSTLLEKIEGRMDVPRDETMLFFSSLHDTMLRLPPAVNFKLRRRIMEITDEAVASAAQETKTITIQDDEDDGYVVQRSGRSERRQRNRSPPRKIKREKDLEKTPPPRTYQTPQLQLAPMSDAWNQGTMYYQLNQAPMQQRRSQDQTQYAWGIPSQIQSQYLQTSAHDSQMMYQPPPPPPPQASSLEWQNARSTPAWGPRPVYQSTVPEYPMRSATVVSQNYQALQQETQQVRSQSAMPQKTTLMQPPVRPGSATLSIDQRTPLQPQQGQQARSTSVVPNYQVASHQPQQQARARSVTPSYQAALLQPQHARSSSVAPSYQAAPLQPQYARSSSVAPSYQAAPLQPQHARSSSSVAPNHETVSLQPQQQARVRTGTPNHQAAPLQPQYARPENYQGDQARASNPELNWALGYQVPPLQSPARAASVTSWMQLPMNRERVPAQTPARAESAAPDFIAVSSENTNNNGRNDS